MALKIENVQEAFQQNAHKRTVKALVAGQPGAGKTRSASTWPNVLFADAEGGLLSVRDRSVHRVVIDSISKLDELRAALAQDRKVREKLFGIPVDTICLDTVDEIAKLIHVERKKAEKLEVLRVQDWGFVADTLRSMLRGFRNLDMNVVMNVHLKPESDSDTGRVWERPDVQGAVGNELAAYVDLSVLLVSQPVINVKTGEYVNERYFQTNHDAAHTWVKDRSGMLPPRFPVNLNDDYQRMADLIFGLQPSPEAPVASPVASVVMSTSDTPAPGKQVRTVPELTDGNGKAKRMVEVPLPAETPPPESVPSPGTEGDLLSGLGEPAPEPAAPVVPVCAECGEPVTNPDQLDISMRRWEVPLCRQDFAKRKSRTGKRP